MSLLGRKWTVVGDAAQKEQFQHQAKVQVSLGIQRYQDQTLLQLVPRSTWADWANRKAGWSLTHLGTVEENGPPSQRVPADHLEPVQWYKQPWYCGHKLVV